MNPVASFFLGRITGGIRFFQRFDTIAADAVDAGDPDTDADVKRPVLPGEIKILNNIADFFAGLVSLRQ